MIKSLEAYLNFNGQCEEALNFYRNALGAEIVNIMRVSDGPKEYHRPEFMNHVMHSLTRIGQATIMASDSMGHEYKTGNNISLTLNFGDVAETEKAFKNMSDGATITMELQDTFWGARYGSLRDKFGICWMFNCEKKQQ